ncbi:transcription factor-like protein DPB [Amaranthus tricolor]|uniref:transcription factor-like protein DPB n=1 Tax=Amaranthus tricolor TaxID=29722 RepID=UPI002589E66A|nr:transcription factor-like protein DPB [Amaranthus tricolor]XP_057519563.1 transcription factor-like protein DPB [Amaranthus tricolor]
MVPGNFQEDGERDPRGVTLSGAPTVSGKLVLTNGSVGSPSSQSGAGMATPARDNTALKLSHLEIHGDDSTSQGAAVSKKKKRGQRASGTDKSGRGLRQFSMKVCGKVESKGRTTYNEVADELVAEYANANNALGPNEQPGYDEKNIRRRVYDALNVLMAMDIISKDKKEIQWKGLPRTCLNDIEELKTQRTGLKNKIEKKAAYLQELEEQFVGYQNLIQRNQQLYGNGNAPTGGVALPFILVQTRPNATVEVEISEDMQLVHFDFNSTPFELHDDNYVLKQMRLCDKPLIDGEACTTLANTGEGPSIMADAYNLQTSEPCSPKPYRNQISQPLSPFKSYYPQTCTPPSPSITYQHQMPLPSRSNTTMKTATSPPLPGILKSRVQHER